MTLKRVIAAVLVPLIVVLLLGPPWAVARGFEIASQWLFNLQYPHRVCELCEQIEIWSRK